MNDTLKVKTIRKCDMTSCSCTKIDRGRSSICEVGIVVGDEEKETGTIAVGLSSN